MDAQPPRTGTPPLRAKKAPYSSTPGRGMDTPDVMRSPMLGSVPDRPFHPFPPPTGDPLNHSQEAGRSRSPQSSPLREDSSGGVSPYVLHHHDLNHRPPSTADAYGTLAATPRGTTPLNLPPAATSQHVTFASNVPGEMGDRLNSNDRAGPQSLIPEEIPTSALLYVLTTSEGRDKMFKTLQYLLKVSINVLNIPDLLPSGASQFVKYWSGRFSQNVTTIRNGRAMFKLFRWVVTLFHLYNILDRLAQKHLPASVKGKLLRAYIRLLTYLPKRISLLRVIALSQGDLDEGMQDPMASMYRAPGGGPTPKHLRQLSLGSSDAHVESVQIDSLEYTTEEGSLKATPVPKMDRHSTAPTPLALGDTDDDDQPVDPQNAMLPAAFMIPANWRKAPTDFNSLYMVLLGVRCVASISRNICRDALFLFSKEFLGGGRGFEALNTAEGQHKIQLVANRAWFVVSLIDFMLNMSRLFNRGWLQFAMVSDRHLQCACTGGNTPVLGADASPTARPTIRKKATLAYPPLDLDFGCPPTVTPKFLEAAPPNTMALSCTKCGYSIVRAGDSAAGTPASVTPGAGGLSRKQSSFSRRWSIMLVPLLIRKAYSLLWALSVHENLKHTLLLQIKYACDLFLSYGYTFGNFEPPSGAEERDVKQHLHLWGSLSGLTSSLLSLMRVYLSAP